MKLIYYHPLNYKLKVFINYYKCTKLDSNPKELNICSGLQWGLEH